MVTAVTLLVTLRLTGGIPGTENAMHGYPLLFSPRLLIRAKACPKNENFLRWNRNPKDLEKIRYFEGANTMPSRPSWVSIPTDIVWTHFLSTSSKLS
jgi:hypothetical protein